MPFYPDTRLIGDIIGIGIAAIILVMRRIRGSIERFQLANSEAKKTTTASKSINASSVIMIRDNGVTVYGSRESAEASMEWADVERNPRRRAFDAKGIEYVFKRTSAPGSSAPFSALWTGTDPTGVELEAKSVIPHPDIFREALIHWLGGKGVDVDHGIDLEALILLASRTSYARPAVPKRDGDHGGSAAHGDEASEIRRIDSHRDARPDAESRQAVLREPGATSRRSGHADADENMDIHSVVIIRANGVTVYDSKEKAEGSMEWSDVMRDPNRRAFDLKGRELRFEHRPYDYHGNMQRYSFWRKIVHGGKWADEKVSDVMLVPMSSIPRPDTMREILVHWLEGNGVKVDSDIALETLIVRASETRNWRRSVIA
jgi:hypothetical protein